MFVRAFTLTLLAIIAVVALATGAVFAALGGWLSSHHTTLDF